MISSRLRSARLSSDILVVKNEAKLFVPPPQFAIHQIDQSSVLIEAIVPSDKPAAFEETYEIYSKKDNADDQWTKVCLEDLFRTESSLVDRNDRQRSSEFNHQKPGREYGVRL